MITKALAVFHDYGNHPWDPILKTGFKHCFCSVASGEYWILIDSRMGLPHVEVVSHSAYDLKQFYEDQGYTVVAIERGRPTKLPFIHSNCVGMVKSVLGIKTFAFTPYQLYRSLKHD